MVYLPREILDIILKYRSQLMFQYRVKQLEQKLRFIDHQSFWLFRYIFIGWGRSPYSTSDSKFGFTLWALKLIQGNRLTWRRAR
jgi:hypothetical protein